MSGLSPQLSVHQEVLSQRVSTGRSDHRGSTGSPTKRKGSEHQVQEVSFCSFGSMKSGPWREGGGRRKGGNPAEHQSVREKEKRGSETRREGETDEGVVTAVTAVSMPPAVCHLVSAYKNEPGTREWCYPCCGAKRFASNDTGCHHRLPLNLHTLRHIYIHTNERAQTARSSTSKCRLEFVRCIFSRSRFWNLLQQKDFPHSMSLHKSVIQ